MKLGVCGDRCDVCPRYLATANDDPALFERIRTVYVKVGLRKNGASLDSLKCRGCSPENMCAYSFVRDCAIGRKIQNCGECSDYPCEKIKEVFRKTEDARKLFERCCTREEFAFFEKAFFRKKEHLDAGALGRPCAR